MSGTPVSIAHGGKFVANDNGLPVSVVGSLTNQTSLLIVDEAAGNNKTFTVPNNTEYEVVSIGIKIQTTATVGNRILAVRFSNSNTSQIYAHATSGLTVAATTTRIMTFGKGLLKETAVDASGVYVTIPLAHGLCLLPGHKINILDTANIDALDSLKIYMLVRQRTV